MMPKGKKKQQKKITDLLLLLQNYPLPFNAKSEQELSFAVPFKGRTERLNQSPGFLAQIQPKPYFLEINYSGLKPNCFYHSIFRWLKPTAKDNKKNCYAAIVRKQSAMSKKKELKNRNKNKIFIYIFEILENSPRWGS